VRLQIVLLLGLLQACGSSADNSPQAQCERQADSDPKVVEVYTRSNGAYTFDPKVRNELLMAKREATMRCMRAKGLAPPGGVQMVEPRI
jgi:hypothetical protein